MSDDILIQFTNCRLVRNHNLIKEDLWVRNDKIINPEPVFFDEKRKADRQINCDGAIIAAGYIDLQINGGYGVDFSYDTATIEEGIARVARNLIKSGVTSFCPTIVTSPPETYEQILPRMPKAIENGASILGLHLEGPFINPKKKGAHPENLIQTMDEGIDSLLKVYGSLENVKIVTLAPEKDPNGIVTRALSKMGVTVALGHSMANLSESEQAAKNGASLITHLFNAMPSFHHRDPGLVGLLASDVIPAGKTVHFGIIADDVHTHPAALRIAYRTHPEGLILITDAISALGLEEGVHHIGQFKMEVRDNKAFLAGTDTLCGSIASMDKCVGILKRSTNCSTAFAIETATLHPARCLGIERFKGTLDFDSDADFIILDDDLNVLSTWINGVCVYES